uniref:Uncharacterized protein n=1 Tax=Oryza nivara TaxID=4536 RepID=A0A0E0HKX4_ORYNI
MVVVWGSEKNSPNPCWVHSLTVGLRLRVTKEETNPFGLPMTTTAPPLIDLKPGYISAMSTTTTVPLPL